MCLNTQFLKITISEMTHSLYFSFIYKYDECACYISNSQPPREFESEYTSSKVEPFKILHEINFHKVTNKNNQHTA